MDNEAQALAEQQAARDAALMAALQAKKRESAAALVLDEVAEAEQKATPVAVTRLPMNRAERRAQVKMYARLLAETERQTPVVNPTIIPKAARRQKKRSRYAH